MKRLREIAEAAQAGGWPDDGQWVDGSLSDDDLVTWLGQENAEHFAVFDPPTVLALLDVAEAARAVADPSIGDRLPIALGVLDRALDDLSDVIPAPSFTDCPDCGQMAVEIIDGVAALTCPTCEGVTA